MAREEENVIKRTVLVKRKQGMSFEDFDRYWDQNHGKVVMSVPEFTRHLRRYVQSHVKTDAESVFPSGDGGFDGYAELWFDDVDGMTKAFSEPRYLEVIRPDEQKFIDLDACKVMVCYDVAKYTPEGTAAVA